MQFIDLFFCLQEKEVLNDIKKLENDFVKEFQKPREDLQLEDSKVFLFLFFKKLFFFNMKITM